MKALLLVLVVAVLPACTKKDEVELLRQEAVTVAKYYAIKLDDLGKRVNEIFERGKQIPGNLPEVQAVGQLLSQANDQLTSLRNTVTAGPNGQSAIERQAEEAASSRNIVALQKLIHTSETTLEQGVTVITDHLSVVESWVAQYERGAIKAVQPPTPPAPPADVQPDATSEDAAAGAQPARPADAQPARPAGARPARPAGAQPAGAQPARPAAAPPAAPAGAQPAPAPTR